ncbi:MAG TPA: CPBP family intramembrane metalloprotease [Anaerolineae bacterium]|nr:CPBP family intramembrane metalloprotease [Anaerolineae bacterium]HQK15341.1 CPBP family intramembrane metalloprotease [Anaerolineae bacterium]
MREISNKNSKFGQRSGIYPHLLIGLAICLSWYVLALVADIPGMILKVDGASALGQSISHGAKLVGGLLLVFGLLPVLLRAYHEKYTTYLRATGILFPTEKHHRVVLIAFLLVAGILFVADLASNGLAGLETYHAAHGIPTLALAAFASLQAAIVEELIFRGIAFDFLKRRFPVWVAILLPAILFGFAHAWWGLGRVAGTAFMGILFALLRWRTDNVWGPIAMHFLINFGFPIPAWVGWLIAVVVSAGLEIAKQVRRNDDEVGRLERKITSTD